MSYTLNTYNSKCADYKSFPLLYYTLLCIQLDILQITFLSPLSRLSQLSLESVLCFLAPSFVGMLLIRVVMLYLQKNTKQTLYPFYLPQHQPKNNHSSNTLPQTLPKLYQTFSWVKTPIRKRVMYFLPASLSPLQSTHLCHCKNLNIIHYSIPKDNFIPMFPYFPHYCQRHPLPNYVSFLTQTNRIKFSKMIDNVIIPNSG